MAVPDYQTCMLPLLHVLRSSTSALHLQEVRSRLAQHFQLTDADLSQRLSSGQRVFDNRVGWAKTYLLKAGLLESPARGHVHISPEGRRVLQANPARIDVQFLSQFPAFLEFRKASVNQTSDESSSMHSDLTPEERISRDILEYHASLASELLRRLKLNSADFFEDAVLKVLQAMGYGGGLESASNLTGGPGDGGIDGVIQEDHLGLDAVYVQAKRYDPSSPVGPDLIREFVGALAAQKVRKGVFITLSRFTANAAAYLNQIDFRIVLIDGEQLVRLMIRHNVGVSVFQEYQLKKIDEDFFLE